MLAKARAPAGIFVKEMSVSRAFTDIAYKNQRTGMDIVTTTHQF
jgi:hypothetical protein